MYMTQYGLAGFVSPISFLQNQSIVVELYVLYNLWIQRNISPIKNVLKEGAMKVVLK